MSSPIKYKDLDILFLHINNKLSYDRHKSNLKNVKPVILNYLNNKSQESARKTFQKSKYLNKEFLSKQKNSDSMMENNNLKNSLLKISNREFVNF